jgi:hypothetical protein
MLAYGVVLVLCVFFLPRGIVPSIVATTRRAARTAGGPPEMRSGFDGLFKVRRGSDTPESC